MASLRSYDLSRYHHLYQKVDPYGEDICTYCGDPAFGRDHVIPISYLASLGDFLTERLPELRRHLLLVPSCQSCNSIGGRLLCKGMADKRVKIHAKLRWKHRRVLGKYDWQEEELAEMGHSLREFIVSQEHRRSWLLARLAWPSRPHIQSFQSFRTGADA